MKIERVQARALHVPLEIDLCGVQRTHAMKVCVVQIDTDDGRTGWGLSGITDPVVAAAAVNSTAAPELIGEDPCNTERLWEKMYWSMVPRGQTGVAVHAISAVDIALWDLKGQKLGEPIWRLLGGARSRVPVYATFGFRFFPTEHIGEAAQHWQSLGFNGLKMTVGDDGLRKRDRGMPLQELIDIDMERVGRVRDAIGPDAKLYVDGNCNLDYMHALELGREIRQHKIEFFEEPITQNDPLLLAKLRGELGIPIAAGQNEGQLFRFRDLLMHQSVDVLQPNVAISGGYTASAKVAGLAQSFNLFLDNGGAWPHFNMHLQGGVSNGGMVEMHYLATEACKRVFTGLPEPKDGWLDLPTGPGLGFAGNLDCIKETTIG